MREELLAQMRQAIQDGSYRFSEHALMEAAEDRLPIGDIERAIVSTDAEVIEDYPQDLRGPSLLVLGWLPDSAPIHAVLSYPPDVVVITVYRPDERWIDYRKRR